MQFAYRMFLPTLLLIIACGCLSVPVLGVPFEGKANGVRHYKKCTIEWHITDWTSMGYNANVTLYHIDEENGDVVPCYHTGPRWTVGWSWVGGETIESVIGGEVVDGDPSIINPEITMVFKNSTDSFAMRVVSVGSKKKNVKVPVTYSLQTTGLSYYCGPSTLVKPLKQGQGRSDIAWRITCVLHRWERRNLKKIYLHD